MSSFEPCNPSVITRVKHLALRLKDVQRQDGCLKGKSSSLTCSILKSLSPAVVSQVCRIVGLGGHHDCTDICGSLVQGPKSSDFLTSCCSDSNHSKM